MNINKTLFVMLASLSVCLSFGQNQRQSTSVLPEMKVDNWQMDQGLPVNSIITVAQTADGWMHFGTEEGLVKFNGTTFFLMNKTNIPDLNVNYISSLLGSRDTSLWIGTEGDGLIRYKNNACVKFNRAKGLSDDHIFGLYEDLKGGLWVGTSGGGLNYLKDGKIIKFDTRNGLASNYVRALAMDAKGRLWVGTQKGLSVIDNGHIKSFYSKDGISDDFIESLAFDKDQNLWIGTKSGGLNLLKNNKFTVYTTKEGLTNNAVTTLCFDAAGILWIGTNGGGITRMLNGKFYPFTTQDGLSSNLIVTLFVDREGNIWAGSSGAGIDRLKKKLIQTISTKNGLPGDVILPVFQDHAGVLWFGVAGIGLSKFENGNVQTFTQKDGLPAHLVLTISEDLHNTLWIGTAGGGLTSYKDKKFNSYTTANGLSNNVVSAVYCDRAGTVWVGTTGGGINRFENGKFTSYSTKEGLSYDNVSCILEDSKGNLWVGTYNGLNIIKDGKITTIHKKNGLSDDYILSLHEDKAGNLWVGTAGNGFNLIRDGKITQFTAKDGLLNEVVLQILEDDFGYFWISCNKGIYKIKKQDLFDFADLKLKSLSPVSYGKADGMETIECNGGVSPAGWKTADGRLLFPTIKGITIIDPNLMKTASSYFSTICMEEFLVDGQLVKITSPLSIPSSSYRLEFRFAALNYTNPEKIKYRCMLVGFDKEWIEYDSRRSAYYTNIPGGDYVFKVMASNESGQWDQRVFTELKFRLELPFYRTFLFYMIVVIVFLLLIFLIYYYFIQSIQRKRLKILVEERTYELNQKMIVQKQTQEELQKTNIELTIAKEKAEESDRLKSAFLANMSHEIRTPLNGILGFMSLLREPNLTGKEKDEYIRIVKISSDRLLNTIHDLIDISKMESAEISVSLDDVNINDLIINLHATYKKEAETKGLQLLIAGSIRETIKTDEKKLISILNHLINNALKYTKKGTVEFGCGYKDSFVEFFIKDTGIGIPENKYKTIFERFVQADNSYARPYEGSGLGLSIAKAYVEVLGGKIWVESVEGNGTTFYFTIPYISEPGEKETIQNIDLEKFQDTHIKNLKILIVEDDKASELILTKALSKITLDILQARTGVEAIEVCRNNPDLDLILMDIKLPEMNGHEATRQIRQFNKDVIIIAQTAFALSGDREKAIAAGCNDYISKPFKKYLLLGLIQKYFQ